MYESGDFSDFMKPIPVDKTDWGVKRSQLDEYRTVMEMSDHFIYGDQYATQDSSLGTFDAYKGLRRSSGVIPIELTGETPNLSDKKDNKDLYFMLEEIFPAAVENLVRTQKQAAAENGYKDFFPTMEGEWNTDDTFAKYYDQGKLPRWSRRMVRSVSRS